MNWFATELHTHTCHSDAAFTLPQLCDAAMEADLSLIALTDHNTLSGWEEIPDQCLPIIRGIEWTTFFGHMVILGANRYVDWRDASLDNIDNKLREIRTAGGLIGIAHPFALGSPMCTGCYWSFPVKRWELVNYIEVWSEGFPAVQTASRRSRALWLSLLDKGYKIAATYGKDWHQKQFEPVPSACTYLGTEAERITTETAFTAISEGRSVVTMGPLISMQLISKDKIFTVGDTVKAGKYHLSIRLDLQARVRQWGRFNLIPQAFYLFDSKERKLACIPVDSRTEYSLDLNLSRGYVRLELLGTALGKECGLAFTSPVYVEQMDLK